MNLTYLKRLDLMLTAAILLAAVWVLDKSLLMPALFVGGYSLIMYDYLRERSKIKSTFGLLVPPGKGRVRVLIIRLVVILQGAMLLTAGAVEAAPLMEYKGLDIKVFAGILLLMAGLLRNKRYLFLLTPQTITFNDQKGWSEWKINDISSFAVRKNRIIFHKGDTSREIIFPDTINDYPVLISRKLKKLWESKATS